MRGRGGCYKHTFYGITSYQCMEATPSLACANKCVFCWRHHKNPVGTEWRYVLGVLFTGYWSLVTLCFSSSFSRMNCGGQITMLESIFFNNYRFFYVFVYSSLTYWSSIFLFLQHVDGRLTILTWLCPRQWSCTELWLTRWEECRVRIYIVFYSSCEWVCECYWLLLESLLFSSLCSTAIVYPSFLCSILTVHYLFLSILFHPPLLQVFNLSAL